MNKVQIHTVEQPDSDITTFVLSCNRLDILDQTLESFFSTRDYPTKMVIVDDSAEPGVFESLVNKYGYISDIICFPKNRGQWWGMDFMVSYCDTEYIFYLEDDWKFVNGGYLGKSKKILQKYRDIGTVDISWKNFQDEGYITYEKELVDESFHYKRPWRVSEKHLYWYGWIGSPNLKRRDDLILLGRVEKWHNEWNIDRRFHALGLKSVYLNEKHVEHLGYECSRMDGKRPNDSTTPEDYFPKELQKNRVFPAFDYRFLDKQLDAMNDTVIVTALLNIGRHDRSFDDYYFNGLKKILETKYPVVVYAEPWRHDMIRAVRPDAHIINITQSDLESTPYFSAIKGLVESEAWQNQAEWLKSSVITNPYYIPLTLVKQDLLKEVSNLSRYQNVKNFYWADAGMYNSFGIQHSINSYDFNKIPQGKFFITAFPYIPVTEVHGYSKQIMRNHAGQPTSLVCRATFFGGSKESINRVHDIYHQEIRDSLNDGAIGTEEAIYTIMSYKHPDLFNLYLLESGDINIFLNTLR